MEKESQPFSRLLVASAWHLISRWELLTFRWPTCHRGRWLNEGGREGRGGRYLVFAFPALVPRPAGEGHARATMNRVNHFRVFNYSAHVLANRGGRFTAISSIVFHRGLDGFIRFRRYQLATRGEEGERRGEVWLRCVIVRFHARQRNYAPDLMKYASHDRALLRTPRLFRWKESVGVDNSIDALARFRVL